jgi:micrococcal nuclease
MATGMHRFRRFALLLALAATWTAPACSQPPAERDFPYVASARGQVYYWVGCDAWRSLAPANLRWFADAETAEAAGYRPSGTRGCAGPEVTSQPNPAQLGLCTVTRIVDGDTLVCAEAAERIRLLLIDAPEMSQGEDGERARVALERILPVGTSARVELDARERDQYGRILAYLYTPDGVMVNEALARQGFVTVAVYPPNVRYVERIRDAVAAARAEGRGLWSESAFDCTPAEHRQGTCD